MTGVLLSGVLDDGVAGLHAIAERGGRVVVQDPGDALYPSMPQHALQAVTSDYVVAAHDIGEVLAKIASEQVEVVPNTAPELLVWENEIAGGGRVEKTAGAVGGASEFACPDCHGVLTDIDGGVRYRCRVGHAWTAEALLAAQGSALERAIWTALRTLEEKAALCRRLADQARQRGNDRIGERYDRQAEENSEAAKVLRHQVGVRG
ncbi:chemotaxis protein CheB [Saccharothrix sp. S26]|uniref:chemotaxis protein CheB n=1 Tax=Saccharothrix sp. S26 TaxID=2907215 RepID=UPI0027E103CC|nr:chemotaxis protein CheB [Saccharothrix sp. S26]